MLAPEQFFYFEILGDNYHKEEIVGLAWGDSRQIYVGSSDLLQHPLSGFLAKNSFEKPRPQADQGTAQSLWHRTTSSSL